MLIYAVGCLRRKVRRFTRDIGWPDMDTPRVKARGQNAPNTYNVTRCPTLVKGIGNEMRTITGT